MQWMYNVHCSGPKTWYFYFDNNLGKCGSIVIDLTLSLPHSQMNCRKRWIKALNNVLQSCTVEHSILARPCRRAATHLRWGSRFFSAFSTVYLRIRESESERMINVGTHLYVHGPQCRLITINHTSHYVYSSKNVKAHTMILNYL